MCSSLDGNVTRGSKEPNAVFPTGAMVEHLLIQGSQQLYRT